MTTKWTALAGIVCLLGVSYLVGSASGQAKPSATAVPSKVALIDMAEVFRQYIKFQHLRTDLTEKIKAKDAEIQITVKKMQALQQKLQGNEIAKGSEDYQKLEKEYVQLGSDLEASRKQAQLELMREEAKNYHTVYLEVQTAVKTFSKHFGYTMVMRFNREELDSNDPQKVIQGLGRQIVYHDAEDDITDGVIEYINRPFPKPAAQKKPAGNIQPAGNETPAVRGTPKTRNN